MGVGSRLVAAAAGRPPGGGGTVRRRRPRRPARSPRPVEAGDCPPPAAGGPRPWSAGIVGQLPGVRGRTPGLPPAGRPSPPLAVRLSCSNGSPDQTIELTSARSRKAYAAPLRRVAYQDPVTKNRYVFVTNNTTWVAQTIADIYKSRWQIELFFKWIKQHLKVKRFLGRSKNAVMTQLWVAMCMYPS